jgi:hypothetical protein
VFGSAHEYLNQIAANYENLYWNFSDGVLRFDVKNARIALSEFDELAGLLMRDARRGANGRILPDEYRRIAGDLDEGHFKPMGSLEGLHRKALGVWNRKHPRNAIHTFSKALECREDLQLRDWDRDSERFITQELPLRRAVLKRLNRALEKWNKAHP